MAKTWEEAIVFVPGSTFPKSPSSVRSERPLPVVIYLHGCAGIDDNNDGRWGRFIRDKGFITVLPNSFARSSRKPNCDPKTKSRGGFPQAHDMRQEEIIFAVDRVMNSSWADKRNVFLMGHSEGGVAAARNRLGVFRGVIISGWHCTTKNNRDFDGIFSPDDMPILTLEWDRDPWFAGSPQDGSCSNKFGERKKARQVLFKGAEHATAWEREAQDAVSQFLMENLAR